MSSLLSDRTGREFFRPSFYFWVVLVMAFFVFGGFSLAAIQRYLTNDPTQMPPVVHLHGVTFISWMTLLMVQTYLINVRNVALHRSLGTFGIALGSAVLFTGALIKRFGVFNIMFTGALLMFGCVAFALNGNDVMHFVVALFALGVGWNFMFIGGTTLLTEAYRPEEKNKVQGANDFLIFLTMATSSFSSGALVTSRGWEILNIGALPFLVIVSAAILWLALRRRATVAGA